METLTKKIVIKQIEETFFKGSQSVNFKGIYKMNDLKVKIEVKKDSYDFQSYARCYVWKDLEWSFVDSIPSNLCNVVLKDANRFTDINTDYITQSIFRTDINTLKQNAKMILF